VTTIDATALVGTVDRSPAEVLIERDVTVPMGDGTVLRAHVYRPRAPGRYPVLVERTPYDVVERVEDDARRLAGHGYVFVAQEVRGRFSSEGDFRPWRDEGWGEHCDGYDIIEWAARQPWSTGDVGMRGGSYSGYNQYLAAPTRPPHLRAMYVRQGPSDLYHDLAFPGGAHGLHTIRLWILRSLLLPELQHPVGRARYQIEPADLERALNEIDEECRRLPVASYPVFQAAAVNWYFEWLSHPEDGPYWRDIDVTPKLAEVDVPIVHLGGWFDPFIDSTLRCFSGIRASGRSETCRQGQRLVVGPWIHGPKEVGRREVGALDFGEAAEIDILAVQERWFDHWLKGTESGVWDEPAVRIFLMGADRWIDLEDWPPPGVVIQPVFFRAGNGRSAESLNGGRLTFTPPDETEAPDSFVYDPAAPVSSLLVYPELGPTDHRPIEGQVLTYTSDPLERDLTVVGPLKAVLFAGSSAPDTDWVVRLCDVWPDGRSLSIRDGILRARYRTSFSRPELMTPGGVYRFEVGLGATAQVFKAGHRLRVEVTSSDFPRYDRNLNTGGLIGTETVSRVATNTVLHDTMRPSHLVLPIMR
jgi:putative CocE/NonD family hydrolase